MIKERFTFEKQQGLYHNKVTLSLTPVQRHDNQAHNGKMDYYGGPMVNRLTKKNLFHFHTNKTCLDKPGLTE